MTSNTRVFNFVPVYRGGLSALHRTHAAAALLYLAGICALAFLTTNPLVLLAELSSVLLVIAVTRVTGQLRGLIKSAIVLALLVAVINPLVWHGGLTLLVRGPVVPVIGPLDITQEASVFGLAMGLRVLVVMLSFGLYTVAVDPDSVLRIFRRLGFRSAVTASVATRMVPVLGRDAQRLSEAQLCRADSPQASARFTRLRQRAPVLRALATTAMERSSDIAMALEVRGFGRARPSRGIKTPWASADYIFVCCGSCLLSVALLVVMTGSGDFQFYPRLGFLFNPQALGLLAVQNVFILAPFILAALRRARMTRRWSHA